MKYTLTITDASASELSKLLASLGGSTAVTVQHTPPAHSNPLAPTGNTNDDDDDETGDNPAAPGTLDKDGLPHDTRIHSDPAKLTTKGVWRKRRGVTDAEVSRVETELRSRSAGVPASPPVVGTPAPNEPPIAIAGAPAPQPTPQPMPQPPAMPGAGLPPPPSLQPMPQPPAAPPVAAPAPTPPQPTGPLDFNGFMQRIQVLLQQKAPDGSPFIDGPYLATVAQRVGAGYNVPCNSITDLAADQRYIDYAVQIMQHDQRWQ